MRYWLKHLHYEVWQTATDYINIHLNIANIGNWTAAYAVCIGNIKFWFEIIT